LCEPAEAGVSFFWSKSGEARSCQAKGKDDPRVGEICVEA